MTRQPFNDLPASQQAGMLCNELQFRRFVGHQLGLHTDVAPLAAAEYIRKTCKTMSRRTLDTNPDARARFDALRTDYDAWRGKIPSPR